MELNAAQEQELHHQLQALTQGVVEIIPEEAFRHKLARSIVNEKPLKVKLGLDPSAPDIHIGHTVVINKLRQFQQFGHHVQLIIGDFTGRIGDPTGKSETRKQLTEEEVKTNAQTYIKQYSKILDMTKTTIYMNSEWLSKLQFANVLELAGKITVARMLERDDFEKRYRSGQPISVHEFFYPLMQGYDSVALESDIELGGTDQKFNLLMGRHLQREFGQEEQVAITTPLLEGLDGVQKMSKSLGNYIGIDENPDDMFGKAMSIPDELMLKYYKLATLLPVKEVQEMENTLQNNQLHPRDAKMNLATHLVRMYHSEEQAQKAKERFQTVFQKGALPEDIPEHQWQGEKQVRVIDLLHATRLVPSKGEGRRMIQQGAVKIDGEKQSDVRAEVNVTNEMIVQVGKRKFCKIILQEDVK